DTIAAAPERLVLLLERSQRVEVLVELLVLEDADARAQALHVAAHEIDQALTEPALAFRLRLRGRIGADQRLPEQEVESQRGIDDLRDRNPACAERQRLSRAELPRADRKSDARHQ